MFFFRSCDSEYLWEKMRSERSLFVLRFKLGILGYLLERSVWFPQSPILGVKCSWLLCLLGRREAFNGLIWHFRFDQASSWCSCFSKSVASPGRRYFVSRIICFGLNVFTNRSAFSLRGLNSGQVLDQDEAINVPKSPSHDINFLCNAGFFRMLTTFVMLNELLYE